MKRSLLLFIAVILAAFNLQAATIEGGLYADSDAAYAACDADTSTTCWHVDGNDYERCTAGGIDPPPSPISGAHWYDIYGTNDKKFFRYCKYAQAIPVTCTAGTTKTLTSSSSNGVPPATANFNGCGYISTGGQVCAALGASGNEWSCVGTWTATGDPATPDDVLPTPNNNCIINADGKELCATSNLNCGSINGQEVCVDSVPQTGTCTFIPGGSFICGGSATPTTTLPDGSPIPAQGTISGTDDQGNPVTGTVFGTQSGSNTGTTTIDGSQMPGTEENPMEIDETGTPTTADGVDTTNLDSWKDSVGESGNAPANPSTTFGLGTQTACNPNQFDFTFRSIGLNIDLCSAIEMIRGALWYLFAGLTIIYLLNTWDQTVRSR